MFHELARLRVSFDLIRGFMKLGMFCEILFVFVSFVACGAPEILLPSVSYHVALQITRRGASVVALVTLVWLFSCVVPHHVNSQLTSLNTGKIAHSASVRLFPRVGLQTS